MRLAPLRRRGALVDRAFAGAPCRLPEPALQARPDQRLGRRADRRPGRERRRRLPRPEGLVQRDACRRRNGSGAVPEADRGLPGRLAGGPRRHRGDKADPRPGLPSGSPGTRRSTPSPTSKRCRGSRRRWSTSSPRASAPSQALFAAYDYCDEKGIGAYGGGQCELGPGRGQIQYLASIFHPETPNDVAPGGYNDPEQATKPGLLSSPLQPAIDETGFRWLT